MFQDLNCIIIKAIYVVILLLLCHFQLLTKNAINSTLNTACGSVDKVLHSRSEGLGFDSHCWSCVVEVSANFSLHTVSNCPAMMGTWWNEKWRIVNGISCRKCAEIPSEEMKPCAREFQYQGCTL